MTSGAEDSSHKVNEADRERFRKQAVSLGDRLAAAGLDENGVWHVYAETEKLIAELRFRLDYETPGVFTKLPVASDASHLVEEARGLLSLSAEEMAAEKLVESVQTLRKARNDLRSYLTEKSKAATKRSKVPTGRPRRTGRRSRA